LSVCFGSLQL